MPASVPKNSCACIFYLQCIMSECKDCSALRGKIVLPGGKKDGTLNKFIKENQHLESGRFSVGNIFHFCSAF